jgi:Fe-coproporphyrin III synthase
MGIGPVPVPILQIHASRKCNLSCPHCYSLSGPGAGDTLPIGLVRELIEDAAELGYQGVAFSGGEPLVYPGLTEVLSHAKSCGLSTSVTTNGTLLQPSRLDALAALVSMLAISLDGPPEMHNEMRGSPTAFRRLLRGLPNVSAAGLRFGFIHTLTTRSWEELPWLAEFAHGSGASLLQIHPLELFGRAGREMQTQTADEEVLMRAYLLSAALSVKYQGKMAIQIDLVHRDQALDEPGRFYATDIQSPEQNAADLLSVVVLEPDGALVPVAYGFSRRFMICDIRRQRFADAWPRYAQSTYPRFRRLCRAALEIIATTDGPQLFNWHDLIVQRSLCRDGRKPINGEVATAFR